MCRDRKPGAPKQLNAATCRSRADERSAGPTVPYWSPYASRFAAEVVRSPPSRNCADLVQPRWAFVGNFAAEVVDRRCPAPAHATCDRVRLARGASPAKRCPRRCAVTSRVRRCRARIPRGASPPNRSGGQDPALPWTSCCRARPPFATSPPRDRARHPERPPRAMRHPARLRSGARPRLPSRGPCSAAPPPCRAAPACSRFPLPCPSRDRRCAARAADAPGRSGPGRPAPAAPPARPASGAGPGATATSAAPARGGRAAESASGGG